MGIAKGVLGHDLAGFEVRDRRYQCELWIVRYDMAAEAIEHASQRPTIPLTIGQPRGVLGPARVLEARTGSLCAAHHRAAGACSSRSRFRPCLCRSASSRWYRSTVNPVTTVLLTAISLVAVMFVVVVAALALAARAYSRRQLDDARAQARHWIERLGGELLVLDGAAVRSGAVAPAGLAEAAERFAAAGAELGAARSRRQCRIAQDTAGEGLHHVRTARRSLGLDPGPRVPGQGVGGTLRAALADGSWSMPRLVDAVLADARGRARQLPAGTPEPAHWIRHQQQQRTRLEAVRR